MVKKVSMLIALAVIITLGANCFTPAKIAAAGSTVKELLKGVSCFKQSGIKIEGEKTVYFDPYLIDGNPKDADIVFITHTHGDHFNISDIKKVMKKNATLVITEDGVSQAKKEGMKKVVAVKPGKSYEVNGIKFSTVAAYNTDKSFHTKESGWVGYIAALNNVKYYIAGDTDFTPEMKKVKADVVFLPVGGTYTMDAKEAAKAANAIKPKVAVPVHFGDVVGTTADARTFISLLDKKITGVVLKDLLGGITHMKQSTIRIAADRIIYIDPYEIEGEPKDADIIFISHTHGDHFSIQDLKKVMKDSGTMLVLPADAKAAAEKEGFTNITVVEPNKAYTVDGLGFKTVPAYNLDKEFHQKGSNWVGYILTVNNTVYYFAGDTDFIPEMKEVDADVVFVPVGGTYTMDAKEAAEAVNAMKPLVAVPIHFADIVGTIEDANTFVSLLDSSIKGVILKK